MTTKSHKTPLRYPGGKSRALSKLFQFIPNLSDYTEYREPFLGGGSVAIEVSTRYPHLKIWHQILRTYTVHKTSIHLWFFLINYLIYYSSKYFLIY